MGLPYLICWACVHYVHPFDHVHRLARTLRIDTVFTLTNNSRIFQILKQDTNLSQYTLSILPRTASLWNPKICCNLNPIPDWTRSINWKPPQQSSDLCAQLTSPSIQAANYLSALPTLCPTHHPRWGVSLMGHSRHAQVELQCHNL